MSTPSIVVVGAGVTGLTIAHELLAQGMDVCIWAARRHPHVTSSVAAAFWSPFLVESSPRVDRWAREAYRRFEQLAADADDNGVRMSPVEELLGRDAALPSWLDGLDGLRRTHATGHDATHDRVEFVAPVIETPIYLPWLEGRIESMGGRFEARMINDLREPLRHAHVVVNATGLGARGLTGDDSLHPVRGQLLRLGMHPDLDGVVRLDKRDPARARYVVPRRDDIIVGGTADAAADLEMRPHERDALRHDGITMDDQLEDLPVLENIVGLRPVRPTVRLEVETLPGGAVIHCYGHGGAGVTVSWGFARDACTLVRTVTPLTTAHEQATPPCVRPGSFARGVETA